MADINDLIIEMKKLTDSIAKSQSGGAAGSPQDQAVRNLKNLSDALEKQRKTLVSSNDTLGRWQRFLTNTTAGYKDLDSSLKNLDNQFEELERSARDAGRSITASEKARYDQERRNIENQQALRASSEELDAALRNTAKTLLQGVFSTAGTLVRDLQSNSSGVQVSGKLLSGAVGAATGAAEVLGNAMTTSGAAMMSLGGKFKWLGGIIGGLGLAVSGVSSAAGKLAKFGIEVLLAEVEKTIEAFQKSSNAGALFTDGMTGLRAAAAGAGLTVEQFGNVLRDNSQNLSRAGVGVAEAARTVGRVGVILKNSNVTEQLIKLGYGFEEQAALSAEVMSDMRRLGAVATDQQIAKQTQELAESFRLLSSITGEDAKKKAEQVRQQNQILAFQQVIATKTPEQQARISAAMSNMTEMEKRAFRDRVMFNGMVRDREAAIYESTLQGAREKGELLYRQLEDNSLTAESVANANAQYGRIIRESGLSQRELAQAGVVAGGALGNVAGGILEAVNQAGQYTDDAVRNAKQGIEGQKNATDSLTQGVVNATVAVQDFRIQLQQILLPFVNDFLRYSQAMLEITKKYTNEIAGVAGTATTPGATGGGSILEKFNVGGMVKGALGLNGIENMGMGEAMTRGALGTLGLGLGFLPGLGPGLRLLLGALGGYGAGNLGDAIFGKRALGGTAIGDRLYLVGEQGPELFRPSTSGEIVNNTVATSPSPSSDPMVSELVQLIKEQLMVNKLTLGTNEDLLQTMSDLRSIQQQFYNNSV